MKRYEEKEEKREKYQRGKDREREIARENTKEIEGGGRQQR